MLNYFLMIHAEPPIIIHEEDRKAYYAALENYDLNDEISLLKDFLQNQTVKTWKRITERPDGGASQNRKRLLEHL